MSLEVISSPHPHFIPGYTGFCPQYKFRVGHTYGSTTHKLMLDPTISHADHMVLSGRSADDYQVVRPPKTDIDVVEARTKYEDPIYKHTMLPGSDGFVPSLNGLLTQAISAFEQQQLVNKEALKKLVKLCSIQKSQWEPKDKEDRMLAESQCKLPLLEVRPECAGIMRNIPVDKPPITPPKESSSPYFMDNTNPVKHLKQGFTGHVPFGYAEFGHTHEPMTNTALCNFTTNYRHEQNAEPAPVTVSRTDAPLILQPSEIYQKQAGQMPSYAGHIPGQLFRFGKTFGNDSRDAKRCLR